MALESLLVLADEGLFLLEVGRRGGTEDQGFHG